MTAPDALPFDSEPASAGPERFATRKAAWEWLVEAGWKISRAQFYAHCEGGKLKRDASGTYPRAAVEKYARNFLEKADGTRPKKEKLSTLAERRAYEQWRLAKAAADEREERVKRLRGEVIPRAEAYATMAGIAQVVRNRFDHWRYEVADRFCDRFGLSREEAPVVIEWLEDEVENLFAPLHDRETFELALAGEDEEVPG